MSMIKRINTWLNEPVIQIEKPRRKTEEQQKKKTTDGKKKTRSPIVLQKATYCYLRVIPMTSVRNYKSEKIIQLVASLYKNLLTRLEFIDKKCYIELSSKLGYYIYIEKEKVEFYFVVPEKYKSMIKERIADTWKGITILETYKIPQFDSNSVCYKLNYKNEDAMSLTTDARTNTLLSSMLNVLNIVEDGDRLGIFYNFMPTSQYTWKGMYTQTLDKYKANMPLEKQKFSFVYLMKMSLFIILDLIDLTLESVTSILTKPDKNKKTGKDDSLTNLIRLQRTNELSPATKNKGNATVVRTQIAIMSASTSKHRAISNGKAICQSFNTISGDNELIPKPTKIPKKLESYSLTGDTAMYMTPKECQNLLSLPGYNLLESYKCIEKIDTSETEVPKELRKGVLCVGTNTYKGKKQKAYLSTDNHLRNLALVLIAPTRAGKSTLIANLSHDAVTNNECTILFDFCGNCQLSDEVSSVVDNVLNINCDVFEQLQGLNYNEATTYSTDDIFMQYRNAKVQTIQLLTLINSVNTDKELSAKMDRYLESAALCVFISGGNTNDVFQVLQDHDKRNEYINCIPENQRENLNEYISSLNSLDEMDKNGEATGTKYNLIAGIIDRVNKLKQNTYMELMFKKDPTNNINLCHEIQKNQLICLRMPEIMFSTESEKDSYCTYWLTKIWLALQMRSWYVPVHEHIKVNIVVDELYQVPNMQEFLRSKLSQMAKFTSKIIISCHYLGQIDIIRNELKSANTSYILISGCDKDNFNELKDELKPFELSDLLSLKRYHALNLLRYEQGYASFITALPPQIKK